MRLIAFFNLKPGVDAADYEKWARERDLPGIRSLVSVDEFHIYRATGVLGREDETPPYQYFEVVDLTDMEGFKTDLGGDTVTALTREMSAFTESATFIITERLPEAG